MEFLSQPNLPEKRVSAVVVDYRTPQEIRAALAARQIRIIESCAVSALDESVRGHSDMMLVHIGGARFVCAPEAKAHFSRQLCGMGAQIITGESPLGCTYPKNAAYNIARFNRYAFHRLDITDAKLHSVLQCEGVQWIHTAQGYSKCNVCMISSDALITSDVSIARAARSVGIDTLQIEAGHIRLPGYDYGFIGGATGLIDAGVLAVAGSLRFHPDKASIAAFCHKHGVRLDCLTEQVPLDIGSILPICC